MATLQVSIPDRVKAAAEAQAAAAGCKSIDDYFVSLIEANELPPIDDELERQLLKGLDSGEPVPLTRELIADIKRRARS